jgi:hypothetical protein
MKRVFFSPFSAIWKHSEIEIAYLFDNVDRTVEDLFLTCDRDFRFYCNTMAAFGLYEDSLQESKEEICKKCINTSKFKSEILPSTFSQLQSYISSDDEKYIENFLNTVNSEDWSSVKFEGINVGRYASYEIFLRYKISSPEIPTGLWQIYRQQLKYCCKVILIAERIFSSSEVSSLVVYNDYYSLNKCFAEVARRYNVPVHSLQASGPIGREHSRYSIDTKGTSPYQLFQSIDWHEQKKSPLTTKEILRVFRHLFQLLKAKSVWVYSERTKVFWRRSSFRRAHGIPFHKKVVLVTLSSQDEWLAAAIAEVIPLHEEIISQAKLIEEIINLASNHLDWFFIIRPHPREYPNKRESISSNHGRDLRAFFETTELPPNVIVNDPNLKTSIYHLIKASDYVFNVLSSVGLEATSLGTPVFSIPSEQFSAYPRELNYYADVSECWLEGLPGYPSTHSSGLDLMAFRWINFRYFKNTKSKSERIPRMIFTALNLLRGFSVKYHSKFSLRLASSLLGNTYRIVTRQNQLSLLQKFSKKFMEYLTMRFTGFINWRRALWERILIAVAKFLINRSIFRIYD